MVVLHSDDCQDRDHQKGNTAISLPADTEK